MPEEIIRKNGKPRENQRILVANIFGIGDVLFTLPLISNLKKGLKNVTIDYLANARTKDIFECVPDVRMVHVYEKDRYRKLWENSRMRWAKEYKEFFDVIRREKYDVVFDFTLSREFGFFFMLCGIPKRIGLDYKRRGLFLTDKVPFKGFTDRHVVEYYLNLAARVGVTVTEQDMRLKFETEMLARLSTYLKERGAGSRPLVAIVPGGGASWGAQASRKRWTIEGFARVADALTREKVDVIVVGDKSETDLCWEVAFKMKEEPLFVENSLGLKDYMGLLKNCDLILCNDGGALHIAVAAGVKTVSIFGPVDEKIYGPYPFSKRHRVVKADDARCRPCYDRFSLPKCDIDSKCLKSIPAGIVAKACMDLLNEK